MRKIIEPSLSIFLKHRRRALFSAVCAAWTETRRSDASTAMRNDWDGWKWACWPSRLFSTFQSSSSFYFLVSLKMLLSFSYATYADGLLNLQANFSFNYIFLKSWCVAGSSLCTPVSTSLSWCYQIQLLASQPAGNSAKFQVFECCVGQSATLYLISDNTATRPEPIHEIQQYSWYSVLSWVPGCWLRRMKIFVWQTATESMWQAGLSRMLNWRDPQLSGSLIIVI